MRVVLWFVLGAGLAVAGWLVSVKVGNDAAGVLVGATIMGGAALGALWANKAK